MAKAAIKGSAIGSHERFRLVKFGSPTCPSCRAMDRAKTIERFVEAHPEVEVQKYEIGIEEDTDEDSDIDDVDNHSPEETEAPSDEDIADQYDVTALPTIVFETLSGAELARVEHAVALRDLEKLYEEAKSNA